MSEQSRQTLVRQLPSELQRSVLKLCLASRDMRLAWGVPPGKLCVPRDLGEQLTRVACKRQVAEITEYIFFSKPDSSIMALIRVPKADGGVPIMSWRKGNGNSETSAAVDMTTGLRTTWPTC